MMHSFLTANPGLNLQTADLFDDDALAQYNWPDDTDRKVLLQSLRIHQRLLKIYPDDKVAEKLESLGFHSAHHIAVTGEKDFAQKVLPELAMLDEIQAPKTLCAKIYANAERIRRASFELALARPRTGELAVTDPSGEGTNPDFQKGIPDYQRLFGPMLTCDCEECQSIFGPAAYFTDLMRVVTQYVTPPLEKLFTLAYRRPDLWTIPLDCRTAETEVSYLDIVNGILLQNLQTNYTAGIDPLQTLSSVVYPFAAPYNQSLLKIRAAMEAVEVPLAGLYKLLETPPPSPAAEMLHLSPEQLSLVTGAHAVSLAELYGFHDTGMSDTDLCASLSNEKLFLRQTGLRPEQLESLVYQQLKRGTGSYVLQDKGSQNIFTDKFSDAALGGSITIECWVYPTATFKEMSLVGKGTGDEFFIYLGSDNRINCVYQDANTELEEFNSTAEISLNAWTHIAWTRDVDTGLNLIYINGTLDSSRSKPVGPALETDSSIGIGYVASNSYQGAITELRLWSAVRTDSQIKSMMYARLKNYTEAGLYAYWPLDEPGGETARDLGPHHYNASGPNAIFTFYESVPLGGNPETNPVLLHQLFLNGLLPEDQFITLTGPDLATKSGRQLSLSNGSTMSALSDTALSQLAVFIRLQAQTGWTYEELDWVLKSVVSILDIPTQLTVNDTLIESLGHVATLGNKYEIPLDELSSFWYDMKTYGRGNDVLPEDLWDRVFNAPPLMADSKSAAHTDYYRPAYASNPLFCSPVLSWTYRDSTDSEDQRLSNQLAVALGISAEDLYAIVQSVIPDGATELALSVPQLSQLYRMARFAKMLQMRVPDFIQLTSIAGISLSDTKLNWTIAEVISLCEKAEWMKKAGLTAMQLAYLSSSASPGKELRLADSQTVDKALSDMRQSAAQVLITPASFIDDYIDASTAQAIYDQLLTSQVIDSNGVILMNESVLTSEWIYQILSSNPETADQIFGSGMARNYVNFDATGSGKASFGFDPFANQTIQDTNCFTISAWVKPSDINPPTDRKIIGRDEGGNPDDLKSPTLRQSGTGNGDLEVCMSLEDDFYQAKVSGFFQEPEQWVFTSWVNDHGNWTVYRNGVPVSFKNPMDTVPGVYSHKASTQLYILANGFDGALSNVSIWTTARTTAEIRSDMIKSDYSLEYGLLAWWPMNEGTGTLLNNRSDNSEAVNGTLSGSYTWGVTEAVANLTTSASISQLLSDGFAAQNLLVVKALAPIAGISADTMSGICFLTSREVDNSAIFTNPPYTPYPYAANMLLNPDSRPAEDRSSYLSVLQRNTAMTRWFKLTGQEAAGIINYSQLIGDASVSYNTQFLNVEQLMTLSNYKSLQSLCNEKNGLLDYFRQATHSGKNTPTRDQLTLLSQLSGWNLAELNLIVSQPYFSNINFNTVAGLRKLADVMAVGQKTGTGIATLNLLRSLSMLNLFESGDEHYWQTYTDATSAAVAILRGKLGDAGVTSLNASMAGELREVLCAWLMWELQTGISGVKSRQELYEYLLIDVNMASDVKTSWMVAAMNSLQLYVNRIINNLEPGAVNHIPGIWWKWMSTYRVWQANREVYLYPENYVDPTLRRFQSPQFQQFINDISKGQITDDNVKKALANYLTSVSKVSSLELVDAYLDPIDANLPGTATGNRKNALFLVAKSRTEPANFFTRTILITTSEDAVNQGTAVDDATQMEYGPWQEIGLSINSTYATTVAALGRQFIFWVEQTNIVNTDADQSKYTTVYATIYYSYRDFNNNWIQPAVLKKDILVQVLGPGISTIKYYTGCLMGAQMADSSGTKAHDFYKLPDWNKVKIQVVPASVHHPQSIMIVLGPYVTCDPLIIPPIAKPDYSGMNEEEKRFQAQLYVAAQFTSSNIGKYSTVIPPVFLDASLNIRDFSIAVDTTGASFLSSALIRVAEGYGLLFDITSSLLESPLVPPSSWWPGTDSNQLVQGTTVIDILSGKNAQLNGTISWQAGAYPPIKDASIPNFTNGSFKFDWSANSSRAAYSFSFWLYLSSGITDDTIIFKSPYAYASTRNAVIGIKYTSKYGLVVEYVKGSDGGIYFVSAQIQKEAWSFITVTTKPYEVVIYLNGISSRWASNAGKNICSTDDYLHFGNFTGYAFGFQFHKVGLTALQAALLYQSEKGKCYLSGFPHSNTNVRQISNSAGAFLFNTGSQSYLTLPDTLNKAVSDCLVITEATSTALHLSYSQSPLTSSELPSMRFVRVNTDSVQAMMAILAKAGINELYKPSVQYLPEETLEAFHPSDLTILPDDDHINFNGAFGVYFWEIFFYAPYLIAEKLRTSQKFDEAEKWFQYIFDPTNQANPVGYWPLNRKLNNNFPDLSGREAATPYNLTASSEQTPPFSNKPREIWNFNPSDSSYLSVPYSKVLNSPKFTVAAWVYLKSVPSNGAFYSIVCSQKSFTGFHFAIWAKDNEWCLALYIGTSDSTWVHVGSPNYSDINTWRYVAATYDGKHPNVFINGDLVTTAPVICENYVCNTEKEFSIGSGDSNTAQTKYFDGSIAEVMLFDHVLSSGELVQVYKNYPQLSLNSNFWNFRPFRRINAESLYHILSGSSWEASFFQPAQYYTASLQMAVYEYDPFDPDTIARLRVNSWQKATFMHYIDNLISWGDSLFTEDTWETLSDATMRYVLANTLLGRMPVKEVTEAPQPPVNYNSIELEYGTAGVPPFLIEMENQLSGLGSDATLPEQVQSILDAYFCIPTNKQLLKYWEQVTDRLYKLRHGLTITGAPNVISLYAAPIDPSALVAATAGGNLSSVSTPTTIPAVPWFRFSYMIAQAKSVTAEVVRLGSELLSALEKKDAEQLSQMQASYQTVLHTLTGQIKSSQINQLQYIGEGLRVSYRNAEYVHNTYKAWMCDPVGPLEALSLFMADNAFLVRLIATAARALAVGGYLVPNIFGLADGGMNVGSSVDTSSNLIQEKADGFGAMSRSLAQMGHYVRRELEWNLQKGIAGNQMKEIQAQMTANGFAMEAALTEAKLSQTELEQSQEVYQFLKSKFTNEELFDWMSGQLSGLYFQMFQLAWSLAQQAQTALQYELNLNQSYLNPAAWNAGYQGLLSGDALSLSLQQMENAYISGNNRKLEIRKTWSMRQNNPQALLKLVSTGNCRFDLNELSYDLDFPGHYNRKIKSLSITIPAVVGPYQNIHATLIQTGNAVTVKPNKATVEYLLGLSNTTPADGSLRINWNPNQEIVISTGTNDAGVFQINFNDEKYLPFEGTGAVSSWSLSIPQASNPFPLRSISDIIITIEYTAEDGGSTYASQVTSLAPLKNYKGWQYLSMRQLYSTAWFDFCKNPVDKVYSLAFELVAQMYPANLDDDSIRLGSDTGEIALIPVIQQGYGGGLPSFFMNDSDTARNEKTGMLPISESSEAQPVPGKGDPWIVKAKDVPDDLLIEGKIDQTKLLDIILIIPFSGTLSW
ncbi:LamG-like jellyroll fold domain-containing protein [Compostibacter hankyongensis]|uniref:LamG-like jellyroll fold domain-containing protein n=1 Tax=Compostibacter hankyongensis TaxID=1007089 RepID=A0ABP8FWQ8_9BACT